MNRYISAVGISGGATVYPYPRATSVASGVLKKSRIASERDFAGIKSDGYAPAIHTDANSDLVANLGEPANQPDKAGSITRSTRQSCWLRSQPTPVQGAR